MNFKLKTEQWQLSWKTWFANYSFKDWRFWFKLIFVLWLTGELLMGYIEPIMKYSVYAGEINAVIDAMVANNLEPSIQNLVTLQTQHNSLYQALVANGVSFGWIHNANAAQPFIDPMIEFVYDGNWVHGIHAIFQPMEYIIFSTTYFTHLSNILVLIWMWVAFIKPKNEGVKGMLSDNVTLICATYITVTFLIYNFGIRPTSITAALANGSSLSTAIFPSVMGVISNETHHTIVPIAFVLYTIFGMQHPKIAEFGKKQMHKNWIQGYFLLFGYAIFAIIYGLLKEVGGAANNLDNTYHYFFLQITNLNGMGGLPGIVWFMVFFVLVSGVYIGFAALYRYAFSKIAFKKSGANALKVN